MPKPAAWPLPYPKSALLGLLLGFVLLDQGVDAQTRARVIAGQKMT